MNKIIKIFGGVLVFGMLFGVVYAYTTRVTIDSIYGVDATGGHVTLANLMLPTTVFIDGTVTYDHPSGVRSVVMTAKVNGELIYGPEEPFKNIKKTEEAQYTIPWYIERPGFYEIAISADGFDGAGVDNAKNNGCPAAPALAVEYLKEVDEKGMNKDIIKTIAQETGKDGDLWAKDSCEPTYRTQTIQFVVESLEELSPE